jgi:hypothetical protein
MTCSIQRNIPLRYALSIALALALPALTTAAPVFAKDKEAKSEPTDKEKKICRREASTGSILPARICHTAAEWAQIDQANQDRDTSGPPRGRDGSLGGYGNGSPHG